MTTPPRSPHVSRRTVVTAAAWAAPALAVAVAAPLAAASNAAPTARTFTLSQVGTQSNPARSAAFTGLTVRLSSSDGQDVEGKTLTLLITTTPTARFGTTGSVATTTVVTGADGLAQITNLYRKADVGGVVRLQVSHTAAAPAVSPSRLDLALSDVLRLELRSSTAQTGTINNQLPAYPTVINPNYPATSQTNTSKTANFWLRAAVVEGTAASTATIRSRITSGGAYNEANGWAASRSATNLSITTNPSLAQTTLHRISNDDIVIIGEVTYNNGTEQVTESATFTIPNPAV